jgi:rhodanese-related sulfurtransferase
MVRRIAAPAIFIFLLALSACATAAAPTRTTASPVSPFITNVSPREASDAIQKNKANPSFIILDVRTPAEFADGHLEKALNIDVSNPSFETGVGKMGRDATYLVYCRTGNRSRTALDIMNRLGFRYIYHLEAGITSWEAAGYPVVK